MGHLKGFGDLLMRRYTSHRLQYKHRDQKANKASGPTDRIMQSLIDECAEKEEAMHIAYSDATLDMVVALAQQMMELSQMACYENEGTTVKLTMEEAGPQLLCAWGLMPM